jgi:hypothetical protein
MPTRPSGCYLLNRLKADPSFLLPVANTWLYRTKRWMKLAAELKTTHAR